MSDLMGANQAETMLRRVSPEGRERAARDQQRRQARTARTVSKIVVAAMLAIATLWAADAILGALTAPVIASIVAFFLLASALSLYLSREKPATARELPATRLEVLPSATAAWLERNRAALPAPAAGLVDGIVTRLDDLGPQIARLRGNEPAADAVRRLLAIELPDLIDRHRSVPLRLRGDERDGRPSADTHLVNGLRIVDEEVGRLAAQLAAGDVDALAIQDRFLELKYQGDEMLRP